MNDFRFTPTNGFEDTSTYPDPANGTQARTQLQSLHNQTKDFINDEIVTQINGLINRVSALEQTVRQLQGN